MVTESNKDKSNPDMQGEGNREAARNYREEQEKFAKSGKVEKKAREAADALDEDK